MLFGKFWKRKPEGGGRGKKMFDRARESPVLHCSICNGEQVAGFKDHSTGQFREVCYIVSEADLEGFLEEYGIAAEELKKEY